MTIKEFRLPGIIPFIHHAMGRPTVFPLPRLLIAVSLLPILSIGCAGRTSTSCQPCNLPQTEQASQLAETDKPPAIGWDAGRVGPYDLVDHLLAGPPRPSSYRPLDAAHCASLAAWNSLLGNLLGHENCLVRSRAASDHGAKAAAWQLVSQMLCFRESEERNKSAGTAMECFYLLAEAHLTHPLLEQSRGELDITIANWEQLRGRGLHLPSDDTSLRTERANLIERQVQLVAMLEQLDGQLCRLLGFETVACSPLLPQADLTATVEPIDVEVAVQAGLANRPDLNLLRLVSCNLDWHTLPIIRATLQRVDGMLGSAEKGCLAQMLPLCEGGEEEICVRQQQLGLLVEDQTRAIAVEIRQAARQVETRIRQVALAKERLELRRTHLQSLREKQAAYDVTAFDISTAQLEVYRSEIDILHAVVAWRVAQVKLCQSQGLPVQAD